MATNEVPDLLAALQAAVNRAREAQGLPPSKVEPDGPATATPISGDDVPDDESRPRHLGPPSTP